MKGRIIQQRDDDDTRTLESKGSKDDHDVSKDDIKTVGSKDDIKTVGSKEAKAQLDESCDTDCGVKANEIDAPKDDDTACSDSDDDDVQIDGTMLKNDEQVSCVIRT